MRRINRGVWESKFNFDPAIGTWYYAGTAGVGFRYDNGPSSTAMTENVGSNNINELLYTTRVANPLNTGTTAAAWVTNSAPYDGTAQLNQMSYGGGIWMLRSTTATWAGIVKTSTDRTTWTTRNLVQTTTVQTIKYGDHSWVAGMYTGDLAVSVDGGTTWGGASTGFTTRIVMTEYVNGLWIITTPTEGKSSTDLRTWTTVNFNVGASQISAVAYGNNTYVAGGNTGSVRSSTDAITWTTRANTFTTQHVWDVTFGNGLFLMSGGGGRMQSSTDGTTWTTVDASWSTLATVAHVEYGAGLWTAASGAGSTGFRTSTDLTTWTSRFGNVTWWAEYAQNTWVVCNNGVGTREAQQAWTTGFVMAADSGSLRTSTNGVTWTTRAGNFGTTNITAVGAGGGPKSGVGSIWQKIKTPFAISARSYNSYPPASFGTVNGHMWFREQPSFILWFSRDMVNWTSTTTANIAGDIKYANGLYATAGSGFVLTSTDLLTWTTRATGVTGVYPGISYGAGVWVVGGTSGVIQSSTDTVTWTTRTSTTTSNINRVVYGPSGFFAVCANVANYVKSTDGVTWTSSTTPTVANLGQAWYANGKYWTARQNSAAYTHICSNSTDLITWTSIVNPLVPNTAPMIIGSIHSNERGTLVVNAVLGDQDRDHETYISLDEGTSWTSAPAVRGRNYLSSTLSYYWSTPYLTIVAEDQAYVLTEYSGIWRLPLYDSVSHFQVALGNSGEIRVSEDSVTWTTAKVKDWDGSATPKLAAAKYTSIARGENAIVATAENGVAVAAVSTDQQGLPDFKPLTAGFPHEQFYVTNVAAALSSIQSIAYGNGLWVIAGNIGSFYYGARSTDDGISFTTTTSLGPDRRYVAYGSGTFLIHSGLGIQTSTDGATWAGPHTTAHTTNIMDLKYINGLFVASGYLGEVSSSTDGVTWTTRASFGTYLEEIVYGGGLYVARTNFSSGTNFVVKSSTDLTSWTTRTPIASGSYLSGLEYVNGQWYLASVGAGATGIFQTSTDAITWTTVAASGMTTTVTRIKYINGLWYFLGGAYSSLKTTPTLGKTPRQVWGGSSGQVVNAVASNTDNTVVIAGGSYSGTAVMLRGEVKYPLPNATQLTYTGGKFHAINSVTKRMTYLGSNHDWAYEATVGVTKVNSTGWILGYTPYDKTWDGANSVMVVGNYGRVAVTTDYGTTWTSGTHTGFGTSIITTAAYGNGVWVFGWTQGIKYTANPLGTWTTATPATTGSHTRIRFGAGLFVNVTSTGKIATSTDGATWITRTSPVATNQAQMEYGNGLFVAASTSTSIKSTDGVTWTTFPSPTLGSGINDMIFDGTRFVIAGSTGIRSSTDAVVWTTHSVTGPYNKLAYTSGWYFGWSVGQLWASTDLVTWSTARYGPSDSAVAMFGNTAYGSSIIHVIHRNTSPAQGAVYRATGPEIVGASNLQVLYDAAGTGVAVSPGMIYTNSGSTWAAIKPITLPADTFRRGSYNPSTGIHVLVGDSGVYASSDLIVWSTVTVSMSASAIKDFISG